MEGTQPAAATITITTPGPTTDMVVTTTDTTTTLTLNNEPTRKKRGGMNLFRVALFMLRGQAGGAKPKPIPVEVASRGMWKRLVGSMRPLHLQHNQSSTGLIEAAPPTAPDRQMSADQFEDVLPPPQSPHPSCSSGASSCDDSMSRYASAVNLQELLDRGYDNDEEDEEDEENVHEGGNGGDEMIDTKAEEFIAQFYEQMRLQRMATR